jgi:hypothetical protein
LGFVGGGSGHRRSSDFIAANVEGEQEDLDVIATPHILDLLVTLREFLPWGARLFLENVAEGVTTLRAPDVLRIVELGRRMEEHVGPWTTTQNEYRSHVVGPRGEVVLTQTTLLIQVSGLLWRRKSLTLSHLKYRRVWRRVNTGRVR